MKKLILLLSGYILLCGCANTNNGLCSAQAAYNAGLHDGQYNQAMQPNYANGCSKKQRARLNDSYLQGYRYGLRHRAMVPPPYVPRSPQHYQRGFY
jgi:hypothetical protein